MKFRLLLSCPDRPGIVAEVSQLIANSGGNVVAAAQFTDPISQHFFMRYEVEVEGAFEEEHKLRTTLEQGLAGLLRAPEASLVVCPADSRPKVALMASKASHCLVDVLQRWRTNELPCDIVCVIANHPHIEEYAGWFKVPFHHVDFSERDKASAFGDVDALLDQYDVDLTVLARFMQVFPDHLVAKRAGHMINIHHSFLPSFMGARPYEQAHKRGVKLVGATCHYVTADLDQGPIIDQKVTRISHRDTPADLRMKGRMSEKEALARGLKLHLEDRVFVRGNRTVIFD